MHHGYLNLPHTILVVLRSLRIRKIGVRIKSDLTRLYNDCNFRANNGDEPFVGALELGALAKQRDIIDHSTVSLQDLTALVLRQHLPKDTSIRISTAWDNPELTSEQVNYAASDVFASWSIFEAITQSTVDTTVTHKTVAGTRVKLLARDGSLTVVAHGTIAPDRPPKFNGINVTQTRVIVNITSIIHGGYLVRGNLLGSRSDTSLSSLGTCPFQLLCYVKDLRIWSHSQPSPDLPNQSAPLPASPFIPSQTPYDSASGESTHLDSSSPECSTSDCLHDDIDSESGQALEDSEMDASSARSGTDIVDQVQASSFSYQDDAIRSRVLGDIWHLMDQFKVSIHHGMRRPFSRALRDALFLPDPADKAAVEDVLRKRDVSWNTMVLSKSDWVWRRVRRFVPKPQVLFERVSEVLQTYGPIKDATTGQPLFNDAAWERARTVLENIRLGYYSDPPGIRLYSATGMDKDGLTIYRCVRGTNNVEGGVHQNIAKRFGSYNASPRFAVNLLREYRTYHNLKVSPNVLNTTER